MAWLKPGPSRHQTALAMIGAKPGDRVLVCGVTDASLIAELALVTGLNGATVALDPRAEARARVDAAAAAAGALVEFEQAEISTFPFGAASFDLVVVDTELTPLSQPERRRLTDECLRVLRPGSRVVLLERHSQAGWLSAWRARATGLPAALLLELLTHAGGRAVRTLADTDDVLFIEARAPRRTP